MAVADRTPAHAVSALARLQAEPYRFDFFHALRVLECAHPGRARLGRSVHAADDPVRLAQEPSLAFAPATLAAYECGEEGKPDRLVEHFFGCFGPNGALPLHLTEYARERGRNLNDHAFARFLDIFHHRLLSLFYRAWADAQPTVNLDRPGMDRFRLYVGSIMGLADPALRDRDAWPDHAKLFYAGRFAAGVRNAAALQAVVGDFLGVEAAIEEFVGEWLDLPADGQFRLGETPDTGALGETLLLGASAWGCEHRFRIVLGPLDLEQYERLLPGGESLRRLCALVRNYVGDAYSWDARLILKKEDAHPMQLGCSGQLGWTCSLINHTPDADVDDLILDPVALGATGGDD